MEKTSKTLIDESVEFAKKIKSAASQSALATFTNLIKEDIEGIALSENFNAGENTPAGYDADGGQKRIAGISDTLEDKGDGPAITEGDEDKGENKEELKEGDKMDMNIPSGEDKDGEGGEDDLDLDIKEGDMPSDEKKEDKEKVEEATKDEPTLVKVNESLKKENASLKLEVAQLRKAVKYITTQLEETALINSKMSYINDIFSKYPSLKVENKRKIVANFDQAKSQKQATFVYETTVNTLKVALGSKKNTQAVTSRAKQIVETAKKNNAEMLNESTKNSGESYSRMAELAGL